MREVVDRARELFIEGLAAGAHGGPAAGHRSGSVQPRRHAVLDKIERQDYRRAAQRGPRSAKLERVRLLLATLARAAFSTGGMNDRSSGPTHTAARSRARSAKNFYYSFLLLSKPQRRCDVRDLCVHALLRRSERWAGGRAPPCDADAGARSWMRRFRAGSARIPCWPAFHDTVRRYQHPARVFPRDDRRRQLRSGASATFRPSMSSIATATRSLPSSG